MSQPIRIELEDPFDPFAAGHFDRLDNLQLDQAQLLRPVLTVPGIAGVPGRNPAAGFTDGCSSSCVGCTISCTCDNTGLGF